MNTELWVALIALGGVLAGQVVTWLIARQSRSDDRDVISKDLQILKQLQPGTDTHRQFEKRVQKNITRLITRQNNRDFFWEAFAFLVPKLYYVILLLTGSYLLTTGESHELEGVGLGAIAVVVLAVVFWLIGSRGVIRAWMKWVPLWVQKNYLKWKVSRADKRFAKGQKIIAANIRTALEAGVSRADIEETARTTIGQHAPDPESRQQNLDRFLALVDEVSADVDIEPK